LFGAISSWPPALVHHVRFEGIAFFGGWTSAGGPSTLGTTLKMCADTAVNERALVRASPRK
jgi:hypothetical protein